MGDCKRGYLEHKRIRLKRAKEGREGKKATSKGKQA